MIKEDTVIMYKHDIEISLIQFLNNNNLLSSYFD